MPRTKTAEQVKKNRRLARIVLILAAVLLCAGAGVLAWLFLRKEPVSGPAPMLAKYQMAEPGGELAKEALPERPALFGEELCVVSGNSEEDPAITAKAGICFDRTTGQVIFSKNAYERLFGTAPKVRAIHAGLECGLFLEKYPHLEMISVGPTMRGVHSPDERLEIAAVERFWKYLIEILRTI